MRLAADSQAEHVLTSSCNNAFCSPTLMAEHVGSQSESLGTSVTRDEDEGGVMGVNDGMGNGLMTISGLSAGSRIGEGRGRTGGS